MPKMILPPEHPGERRDSQVIAPMAKNYPDNAIIPSHFHRRSQLVFASSGVMTITTDRGAWVVPPQRAVWVPAGVEHEIRAAGQLKMRTLYIEPDSYLDHAFPDDCVVIDVTPLMREIILRSVQLGGQAEQAGRLGRLTAVLLDEAKALTPLSLHLPIPNDRRAARVCEALLGDPSIDLTLSQWGLQVGASARTLARVFSADTGMSFAQWRQKSRLLASLPRLARGEPILSIALDLGYDSPSAFSAMFRRSLGTSPSVYFRTVHYADEGRSDD